MANWWHEFAAREEHVCAGFRRRAFMPEMDGHPVGQLLALPSFANPCCWDILRRFGTGEASYFAVRSCWRKDRDLESFRSIVGDSEERRPFGPTIEVEHQTVSSSAIAEILAELRDVRIPVAVSDDSAGFDGVFYELEIENVWTSCRIRWWCDLPSAWQGLKAPVAKMFEVLEAG